VAKLRDDDVTASDLQEFIDSKADFAFEMRVLKRFEELGYTCEHGGTYRDPITDKIRQFDIRAHQKARGAHLAVAAECKNIGDNFPLLVHAVPRKSTEAFHTLIVLDPKALKGPVPVAKTVRAPSRYKPDGPVGKRMDQVGRTPGGDLVGGDQDVFEKVSQSVNSTFDRIQAAAGSGTSPMLHAVVPLLVVPDGRLWQVDYSPSGEQQGSPHVVEASTMFLDQAWQCEIMLGEVITFRLSHYELTTLGALQRTLTRLWQPTEDSPGLFHPTARELDIPFGW